MGRHSACSANKLLLMLTSRQVLVLKGVNRRFQADSNTYEYLVALFDSNTNSGQRYSIRIRIVPSTIRIFEHRYYSNIRTPVALIWTSNSRGELPPTVTTARGTTLQCQNEEMSKCPTDPKSAQIGQIVEVCMATEEAKGNQPAPAQGTFR